MHLVLALAIVFASTLASLAQIPPGPSELGVYTGLHAAAVKGDASEIERLIAAGGKPNVRDSHGRTPLHVAAHFGHHPAAQAPLNHVNNLGWTALIESIVLGNGGRNHTDTLEALVKAGANVNIADRQGVTPLGLAKSRGYAKMVRLLENAGAK